MLSAVRGSGKPPGRIPSVCPGGCGSRAHRVCAPDMELPSSLRLRCGDRRIALDDRCDQEETMPVPTTLPVLVLGAGRRSHVASAGQGIRWCSPHAEPLVSTITSPHCGRRVLPRWRCPLTCAIPTIGGTSSRPRSGSSARKCRLSRSGAADPTARSAPLTQAGPDEVRAPVDTIVLPAVEIAGLVMPGMIESGAGALLVSRGCRQCARCPSSVRCHRRARGGRRHPSTRRGDTGPGPREPARPGSA